MLCVRSAEQFGVCLSLKRHVVWCPQLLWARDILLFARLSLLCDHGKLARDPGEHGPDSGSRCVEQAPAQAVPPAQVPHPPVPFPPPPPQIPPPAAAVDDPRVPPNVAPPPHYPPQDFGEGPVGESHFLRPCRFCGHTSYWREGVCLSECCRASWLHLVCFFFVKMSVCCALRLATATRTWT